MPHLEKSDAASVVVIASTAALETFAVPMAYSYIEGRDHRVREQLSGNQGREGHPASLGLARPDLFRGRRLGRHQGDDAWITTMPWSARSPAGRMGGSARRRRASSPSSRARREPITGANIVADNGLTKRVQF